MEKYGRTWKLSKEKLSEIEYVWKVITFEDGVELWEENQIGRLFLRYLDDTLYETEF